MNDNAFMFRNLTFHVCLPRILLGETQLYLYKKATMQLIIKNKEQESVFFSPINILFILLL